MDAGCEPSGWSTDGEGLHGANSCGGMFDWAGLRISLAVLLMNVPKFIARRNADDGLYLYTS